MLKLLFFFSLFACSFSEAKEGLVEKRSWKGGEYRVVSIDLDQYSIQLHGKLPQERTIKSALLSQEKSLLAMNGGMFHSNREPVGLHIENAESYVSLNRAEGEGNFFLKPNGMFVITTTGEAMILDSDADISSLNIALATQSGPLLLHNDQYHHALNVDSPNFQIRNGICVVDTNHVFFVISDTAVRFYDLASLMKEELGCHDGLYLDGFVSVLQERTEKKLSTKPLGPILVLGEK